MVSCKVLLTDMSPLLAQGLEAHGLCQDDFNIPILLLAQPHLLIPEGPLLPASDPLLCSGPS